MLRDLSNYGVFYLVDEKFNLWTDNPNIMEIREFINNHQIYGIILRKCKAIVDMFHFVIQYFLFGNCLLKRTIIYIY
jgi:hypothetical protein